MKLFHFLILLVLIAFVSAIPQHRGCQYILGRCVHECPVGTHSYGSSCIHPTKAERTCDNPTPEDLPPICDLSRCDCDEPTVKDKTTGNCVTIENCPPKKA